MTEDLTPYWASRRGNPIKGPYRIALVKTTNAHVAGDLFHGPRKPGASRVLPQVLVPHFWRLHDLLADAAPHEVIETTVDELPLGSTARGRKGDDWW